MKKLVKKILPLSIIALSMSFSSISYGEPEITNAEAVGIGNPTVAVVDNFLLTFMKKSQVLVGLSDNLREDVCSSTGIGGICSFTPEELEASIRSNEVLKLQFGELHHQLIDKLENLAKSEKELMDSNTVFDLVKNEAEVDYSSYPNIHDSEMLNVVKISDVKSLVELQEGLTETESKKLQRLIFDDLSAEHNKFVEEHRDLLDAVQKIANKEFKMIEKKCRSIQGKEFCIEAKGQEFKSLSEIALYAIKLQAEKPTKAPVDQEKEADSLAQELPKDGSIPLNEQKANETASAGQAPEENFDKETSAEDEPAAPEDGL